MGGDVGGVGDEDVPSGLGFDAVEPSAVKDVCLLEGYLGRCWGGGEGAEVGVVLQIFVRKSDGEGGDVDAVDLKVGECGGEERVEEEGDAACAGAEVEDAEGGGSVVVGEEGVGEVGDYGVGFWSWGGVRWIDLLCGEG